MHQYKIVTSLILILFLFFQSAFSEKKIIYKIDLKQEVNSTSWLFIQEGIKNAHKESADFIILDMNTYGGMVVFADSIRTLLLKTEIPTIAYINNNAASAGALIAIACDSIYMKKGANMGAVTVVNQTGEKMPDKYQSYMRATIRSTAEAHGRDTIHINGRDSLVWRRDPNIAQAMVDEKVVVEGISKDNEVLTFTAEEALKNNYCEGIADNIDELVVNNLRVEEYVIKSYEPTLKDRIMGFLLSPALHSILIMVMVLGIYYEIKSPGIGFPSFAAIVAAILYFAPLYFEGLAQNWEIILFVFGVILIIAEVFFIPGFGVAGISGIILMSAMLILALVNNDWFDFDSVSDAVLSRSILTVSVGLILSFIGILVLLHFMGITNILRWTSLNKVMSAEEGFIGVSQTESGLIGKEGYAQTMLRPVGKVSIDNEQYNAVACIGYIERGDKVKVIRYENAQIYVIKK